MMASSEEGWVPPDVSELDDGNRCHYIDLEVNPIYSLKPVIVCTEETMNLETKTGKLLEQALGRSDIITEFEVKRMKLKKWPNSSLYLADYKDIVARLEIIVLNKHGL